MKRSYRARRNFIHILLLILFPLLSACPKTTAHDIESYRLTFLPPMQTVQAELRELFPADRHYDCKCRLKKTASIQEKIARKGYAGVEELTDIAGCRVSFPNLSRVSEVEDTIQRHFRVIERKNHLEDKRNTGYRAVHYLIVKDRKIVELQLRTFRQDIWSDLSHKWAYKGPYSDNKIVNGFLLNLSRAIYALDRGGAATLPELPPGLPEDFRAAANESLRRIRTVGK